jgi:hypothetical protein
VSRADLLAGRDPTREAAIEWIAAQQAGDTGRIIPRGAETDGGNAVTLAGGQQAGHAVEALPAATELIDRHVAAIGGREAIEGHTSSRVTGSLEIVGQGLVGEMTVYAAAPDKTLLIVSFAAAGIESRTGYDGTVGWSIDSLMGERLLHGGELAQISDESDFHADLHAPEKFTSMETIGLTELAGQQAYKVRLVHAVSGREIFEYFAVDSGLMIGTEGVQESLMGSINVVTEVHDYQPFGNLLVPTRILQQIGPGQSVVATIEDVELDTVDPAIFELPAAIKALIGGD